MVTPPRLEIYCTPTGRLPFAEWMESLKDLRARAAIRNRLDRVELGNLGDYRSIGGGLSELRVDFGPGYRIYLGREGTVLVILLCGGDKRTQKADIARAKRYWENYRRCKDA